MSCVAPYRRLYLAASRNTNTDYTLLCRPNRRFKLCGRGLRAEADAARRLRAGACPATARVAEGDAQLELRRRAARQPCELTSRLGRRASAGPHQLLTRVRSLRASKRKALLSFNYLLSEI